MAPSNFAHLRAGAPRIRREKPRRGGGWESGAEDEIRTGCVTWHSVFLWPVVCLAASVGCIAIVPADGLLTAVKDLISEIVIQWQSTSIIIGVVAMAALVFARWAVRKRTRKGRRSRKMPWRLRKSTCLTRTRKSGRKAVSARRDGKAQKLAETSTEKYGITSVLWPMLCLTVCIAALTLIFGENAGGTGRNLRGSSANDSFMQLPMALPTLPGAATPNTFLPKSINTKSERRRNYWLLAIALEFGRATVAGMSLIFAKNMISACVSRIRGYQPLNRQHVSFPPFCTNTCGTILCLFNLVFSSTIVMYCVQFDLLSAITGLRWEVHFLWYTAVLVIALVQALALFCRPGSLQISAFPMALASQVLPYLGDQFDTLRDAIFAGICVSAGGHIGLVLGGLTRSHVMVFTRHAPQQQQGCWLPS